MVHETGVGLTVRLMFKMASILYLYLHIIKSSLSQFLFLTLFKYLAIQLKKTRRPETIRSRGSGRLSTHEDGEYLHIHKAVGVFTLMHRISSLGRHRILLDRSLTSSRVSSFWCRTCIFAASTMQCCVFAQINFIF